MCAVLEGTGGQAFSLPYPDLPTPVLLPFPCGHTLYPLVQGLEYLELGPAAGAAELVDCAINFVVVTRVREAAAAEAAGSGRAWGIERKRERKRKRKREHIEGVRQGRGGIENPREDVVGAEVGQQKLL